jgi:hypothetical protein
MAWKGLRGGGGIVLFPLLSQEVEQVALSPETDDVCVRVASFESRPAKICADNRYPFLVAPLILSMAFENFYKVRGLNIQ